MVHAPLPIVFEVGNHFVLPVVGRQDFNRDQRRIRRYRISWLYTSISRHIWYTDSRCAHTRTQFHSPVQGPSFTETIQDAGKTALRLAMQISWQGSLHDFAVHVFPVQVFEAGPKILLD